MFLPGLSDDIQRPHNFNPTTQGKCHIEQKEREFFLGNFDQAGIALLQKNWTVLRVGNAAYDKTGNAYPNKMKGSPYLPRPVFVERNEALEKRYVLRTAKKVPVSDDLLRKIGLTAS
ncbi:MAG: hypothetical protein Q7S52_04920 [bacterium]|nr:hypothetical protein [bacterium]